MTLQLTKIREKKKYCCLLLEATTRFIEKVKEYTFKLDESIGQFVDRFQDYGFQDPRELVISALERLQSALELAKLEESAALYAEIYQEDPELQALTEAGLEEWPLAFQYLSVRA